MFCSKCGSKLSDGASFCTNCGNDVTNQIPTDNQVDVGANHTPDSPVQDLDPNEQPQANIYQPQSNAQSTNQQYTASQPQYQQYQQQQKNHTLGIIIGVIAGIAIIGAIVCVILLGKCTMTINTQDNATRGDSTISADASQYVGKWVYDASSYSGDDSSSLKDLYGMFDLCTLELYDNGTFRLEVMSESMIVPSSDTKWETTSSGISLSYQNNKYNLAYNKSKDQLSFSYEGTDLVLKRSDDTKTNTVTL